MSQKIESSLSHKLANMGFVCVCLMVSLHVSFKASEGVDWWIRCMWGGGLAQMAVPFFFLASGYFLAGHAGEQGWWPREFLKRLRTLYVPFLLWTGVLLTFLWARGGLPEPSVREGARALGLIVWEAPTKGDLWYVRNLLVLVLISPILLVPMRKGRWWGVAVLAASFLVWFGGLALLARFGLATAPSAWYWKATLFGQFYFACGLFLRLWPVRVKMNRICAIALLVLALGMFCCAGYVNASGHSIGTLIRHFTLPVAMMAVWGWIPSRKWPSALTSATFPIYLSHSFGLILLGEVYDSVPGGVSIWLQGRFVGYLVSTAAVVCVCLLFTIAFRRMCPKVAGVFFGGR